MSFVDVINVVGRVGRKPFSFRRNRVQRENAAVTTKQGTNVKAAPLFTTASPEVIVENQVFDPSTSTAKTPLFRATQSTSPIPKIDMWTTSPGQDYTPDSFAAPQWSTEEPSLDQRMDDFFGTGEVQINLENFGTGETPKIIGADTAENIIAKQTGEVPVVNIASVVNPDVAEINTEAGRYTITVDKNLPLFEFEEPAFKKNVEESIASTIAITESDVDVINGIFKAAKVQSEKVTSAYGVKHEKDLAIAELAYVVGTEGNDNLFFAPDEKIEGFGRHGTLRKIVRRAETEFDGALQVFENEGGTFDAITQLKLELILISESYINSPLQDIDINEFYDRQKRLSAFADDVTKFANSIDGIYPDAQANKDAKEWAELLQDAGDTLQIALVRALNKKDLSNVKPLVEEVIAVADSVDEIEPAFIGPIVPPRIASGLKPYVAPEVIAPVAPAIEGPIFGPGNRFAGTPIEKVEENEAAPAAKPVSIFGSKAPLASSAVPAAPTPAPRQVPQTRSVVVAGILGVGLLVAGAVTWGLNRGDSQKAVDDESEISTVTESTPRTTTTSTAVGPKLNIPTTTQAPVVLPEVLPVTEVAAVPAPVEIINAINVTAKKNTPAPKLTTTQKKKQQVKARSENAKLKEFLNAVAASNLAEQAKLSETTINEGTAGTETTLPVAEVVVEKPTVTIPTPVVEAPVDTTTTTTVPETEAAVVEVDTTTTTIAETPAASTVLEMAL